MTKQKLYRSKGLLQYIYGISKPFHGKFLFILGFVFLESLVTALMLPRVLESIIDRSKETSSSQLWDSLKWLIPTFLGLQLIGEISLRSQDYLYLIKTVPNMRKRIIEHGTSNLLKQSYRFYEKGASGQLSENVLRLSGVVVDIIETCLFKIFFFLLTSLFTIYALWCIEPTVALFFVLFLICTGFFLSFFGKKISTLSVKLSQKRASISGRIVDIFVNVLTIKLFNNEDQETKFLNRKLEQAQKTEKRLQKKYFSLFVWLGLGWLMLEAMSFYLLIKGSAEKRISTGEFVAVLYINETIITLVWYDLPDLTLLPKQVGKAKQALQVITSEVELADRKEAKPLICNEGHISFQDITFSYKKRVTPLFKNLTLEIPPGKKFGIVGASGGGKTTLIKLLVRFLDVESGAILIDGQKITEVTQASLRQAIGVITQDPSLFCRSLRENIQYGHPETSEEQMIEVTKKALAHDFILETEHGYETLIGERGSNLSGGQRQRIAIARVLLKNPKIIVLDEATSQLDPSTEQCIEDMLHILTKGKTTLVIAHRFSTLLRMDKILVFNKGKIVEQGTHEELLAQKGLYLHLWQTQANGFVKTE